jgi:hypothetical protein
MLQLLRVAGQIDCDDSAVAVFDGHRTDRSIILAYDEARKPASPLTVAGRAAIVASAGFLRATSAKKREIRSAPRIGLRGAARFPPSSEYSTASLARI